MANIVFLEPGGESTGGLQLWDSTDAGIATIDTTIKPSWAYSSINSSNGVLSDGWDVFSVLSGTGRISFYFYIPEYPPLGSALVAIIENTDKTNVGSVRLNTAGKLKWVPGDNFSETIGTTVLALNTWYRISFSFNANGDTDNLDVNLFINGNVELALTAQTTGGIAAADVTSFGFNSQAATSHSHYYSHFYADDGGDLSDTPNVRITAKFPTSVNVNSWDTTGGTGAVNERPLSETNYKAQASSTQASQNYNIQSVSAGDVDITGATILGYMGWVWAKEAAVSGTPKITVNGVDYAVTLTTSPAIHRQCVTSSTYPSNAATIGMVSSGTTDDTFMYECGIVIAFVPLGKLATLFFAGN